MTWYRCDHYPDGWEDGDGATWRGQKPPACPRSPCGCDSSVPIVRPFDSGGSPDHASESEDAPVFVEPPATKESIEPVYVPLRVVGLCLSEAYEWVWPEQGVKKHAHHKRPQGGLFACGIESDGKLVAIAVAARPNARHSDRTAKPGKARKPGNRELWITRVAVERTDGAGVPNAASMIYAAMRKAGAALGYRPVVTYCLPSEGGASLRAAGFRCVGERGGGKWGGSAGTRYARDARADDRSRTGRRGLSNFAENAMGVAVSSPPTLRRVYTRRPIGGVFRGAVIPAACRF